MQPLRDESQWERHTIVVHQDSWRLIQLAMQAMRNQGVTLNDNPAIARGQAIEWLAADYLAGMGGCYLQPKEQIKQFPGNWG